MSTDAQSSDLQLPEAQLRKAFAYWNAKRGDRRMPRRTDIDPIEMPSLLANLRLVEVHGPGRYRYRLVGSEVVQFHGGLSFKDQFVHEAMPPAIADQVIPVYDECVAERRPLYLENTFLTPDKQHVTRHSRVLFLPLSEDDLNVSMVLVIQIFVEIEARTMAAFDPWATHYVEIERRLL